MLGIELGRSAGIARASQNRISRKLTSGMKKTVPKRNYRCTCLRYRTYWVKNANLA